MRPYYTGYTRLYTTTSSTAYIYNEPTWTCTYYTEPEPRELISTYNKILTKLRIRKSKFWE